MAFYAFVVGFREALEAALLTGIILGTLAKLGEGRLRRHVWYGVAAAVALSLGLVQLPISVKSMVALPTGRAFEAWTMFLGAGMLTWMLVWMRQHGASIRDEIEARLRVRAGRTSRAAIALFAFITILREGVESVVLLRGGVALGWGSDHLLEGAAAGIAAAALIGYLFFRGSLRLNPGAFFQVTSWFLVLFGAGLLSNALRTWQEMAVLPSILAPLWDTSSILNEDLPIGSVARTLLGYSDQPSLLQFGGWLAYLLAAGSYVTAGRRRAPVPRGAAPVIPPQPPQS